MAHDVSNPHPMFGKDPNIINEYGHTHYPKWVENSEGNRVIVQDAKEEMEATGKKPKAPKGGWAAKDAEKETE